MAKRKNKLGKREVAGLLREQCRLMEAASVLLADMPDLAHPGRRQRAEELARIRRQCVSCADTVLAGVGDQKANRRRRIQHQLESVGGVIERFALIGALLSSNETQFLPVMLSRSLTVMNAMTVATVRVLNRSRDAVQVERSVWAVRLGASEVDLNLLEMSSTTLDRQTRNALAEIAAVATELDELAAGARALAA